MKLAFCLFRYFPFGGMQRDFLRIANSCLARGHSVEVYTWDWEGAMPDELKVFIIPIRGLTNRKRRESFSKKVGGYLAERHYDVVVGFNKMPYLDVYFAADTCYID